MIEINMYMNFEAGEGERYTLHRLFKNSMNPDGSIEEASQLAANWRSKMEKLHTGMGAKLTSVSTRTTTIKTTREYF